MAPQVGNAWYRWWGLRRAEMGAGNQGFGDSLAGRVGLQGGGRHWELREWGGEGLGSGGGDAFREQWDTVTRKGARQTNTGDSSGFILQAGLMCQCKLGKSPTPLPTLHYLCPRKVCFLAQRRIFIVFCCTENSEVYLYPRSGLS